MRRTRVPAPRIWRGVLIGLFAAGAVGSWPFHSAAADRLVVGVRSDARPFSYFSRPTTDAAEPLPRKFVGRPVENGFEGYVVRVCDAVLKTLEETRGIKIETWIVHAHDRFELLENGSVHILCDPATIVPERLEKTYASTPIYMSAITYAGPQPLPAKEGCRSIVGVVSETTAETRGLRRILESGSWPRYRTEVLAAVKQIAMDKTPPLVDVVDGGEPCDRPVVRFYSTHDELAEDFCEDRTLYYVGDIEIVRAKIDEKGCLDRVVIAPAVYTDERYAIFTALPNEPAHHVPARLILQFLAELSRQVHNESESLLVKVFREINDENYNASEKLRTFFWSLTGDFPE